MPVILIIKARLSEGKRKVLQNSLLGDELGVMVKVATNSKASDCMIAHLFLITLVLSARLRAECHLNEEILSQFSGYDVPIEKSSKFCGCRKDT